MRTCWSSGIIAYIVLIRLFCVCFLVFIFYGFLVLSFVHRFFFHLFIVSVF